MGAREYVLGVRPSLILFSFVHVVFSHDSGTERYLVFLGNVSRLVRSLCGWSELVSPWMRMFSK